MLVDRILSKIRLLLRGSMGSAYGNAKYGFGALEDSTNGAVNGLANGGPHTVTALGRWSIADTQLPGKHGQKKKEREEEKER